jgi:ubiquitin carboxyl-terminal hydrolase 16/45
MAGSKKKVSNRRLATKAAINDSRRKNKVDAKEITDGQHEEGHEIRQEIILTPISWIPKGLQNLGNTCFFNATIQALSSCLNELYPLHLLPGDIGFLNKIFMSVLTQNNHSVPKDSSPNISSSTNPSKLLAAISKLSPQFKGRRQQDAHEVYVSMIAALDDEKIIFLRDNEEKGSKFLPSTLFTGSHASILTCLECRNKV